ncbi:hypothetical protein HZA33_04465 [Candidatus Pacearchaeota archaeon]|nr:hypothetical protein [Candidatus Pacearchaeota archaeon]
MVKLFSRGKVRDIYEIESGDYKAGPVEEHDFTYKTKHFVIKGRGVYSSDEKGLIGTLLDDESYEEVRKAILKGQNIDALLSKMFFKYEIK